MPYDYFSRYEQRYTDLRTAAKSDRYRNRERGTEGRRISSFYKTYQILKTEGFIEIDRRKGATVRPVQKTESRFREKLEAELELLSAEACLKGMPKEEFLRICEDMFMSMHPAESEV